MDARDLLAGNRIVPVVVLNDTAAAVPLAETLVAAGIGAIEITLRSKAALDAIREVASADTGILVGAGSIRRVDQLEAVASAGASFAVSPGSSPAILAAIRDMDLALVPGAETATEMMGLLDAGYVLQKFFPAEQAGGLAKLRSVSAPLPEVRFFPTGGINAANVADYLAFDRVTCVGGSWFVPAALIDSGDFTQVGTLAKEALEAAGG